jgi:hypothetical protein
LASTLHNRLDKRNAAIRLPRDLRRAVIASALIIAISTIVASAFDLVFIPTVKEPLFVWLTAYFFQTQDLLWLAAIAVLLLGLALTPLPVMTSRPTSPIFRAPCVALAGLAVFVFISGLLGTHIVFDGYHLSRDEFLAEFDAIIFRSGKEIASIDPLWRPFASALAPRFMLPIPGDVGFASAYLPVNAGFRAIIGLVANSDLPSPLFAGTAVLATFGVARRIWPERADAAFVSALLVGTSSQILVTSMTSYAMTAHLALNMVWLWFFLRDDKNGHGAAIATGFLASGLHQLIFHPLFVTPFIVRLFASGRRSLALVYVLSYVCICIFWISYWKLVLGWQGIPPQISDDTGPMYFLVRIFLFLANFQWAGTDLMLKNILRFVAWQSPALLPLVFLAYTSIRHDYGIARELIAGLLLTLIAMFILLPYQGHGWGYRYFHGLIGSAALLGGYGWIALANRDTRGEFGAARTMFVISSAVAWLVLLPAHAKQAHDFVLPYVRASKAIEQTQMDAVIVDKSRLLFAEDLVRNDPFLHNRPKVLDLTNLSETDIERLCMQYSVAIFDYRQALALGVIPNDHATEFGDEARARLRAVLSRRECGNARVVPSELGEQPH